MSNENVTITLDDVILQTVVPEALVTRIVRPIVGARRDTFVDVPGRESAWTFTEEPGDRVLTIEVDLQAVDFDDRRDAVTRVADWADTLAGRVRLIFGDQPDRFWDAILEAAPELAELLTFGTGDITYRVGPYASSITLSTESFSGTGGNITHNWVTVDDVISYPIITLTGRGGNLDSPTVTLNGDSISIIESFPADVPCVINSVSSVVTSGANVDMELTGFFDPDDLTMSRVSGQFGLILPGANSFAMTYDGAATSVDIDILWRRRFR